MKTISMPIEEYEKALADARSSGYDQGARWAVSSTLEQIIERLETPGYITRAFQDESASKAVKKTVERLNKFFLSKSFKDRSLSDLKEFLVTAPHSDSCAMAEEHTDCFCWKAQVMDILDKKS